MNAVCASNSDGTLLAHAYNVPSGTNSVTFQDTTVGGAVNVLNTTSSIADHTFPGPKMGVSNSVAFKAYSAINGSGTLLASTSAAGTPAMPAPTVSVQINGTTSGVTWAAASTGNVQYSFTDVTIEYSINGGAYTSLGSSSAQSGSVPDTSVNVGYSSTITWRITAVYGSATYTSYTVANTKSGTTGSPPVSPPSAPNPATGLTAVDHTSSVDLSWTASVGGATGYQVKRGSTVLGTTSGTSYTDNTPGATRPLTYTVTAYNSNSGGTTYASGAAVTVGATAGQPQQMIL